MLAIPTVEAALSCRNPTYLYARADQIYSGGAIRALAAALIGILGHVAGVAKLRTVGFAASGLIASSAYTALIAETHDCYRDRGRKEGAYFGSTFCAIASAGIGVLGHYAGVTTAKIAGVATSALTVLGMCVAAVTESPAPRRIT